MSEIGELTPRGRKVAYARGCHPEKDEDWWDTARAEAGGDDFGESLDLSESMTECILTERKLLKVTVRDDSFLTEC